MIRLRSRITALAAAGVTASALALAPAPAPAGGIDTGTLIAGAAGLAAIGIILSGRSSKAEPATRAAPPLPQVSHRRSSRSAQSLPNRCALDVVGVRRSETIYGAQCLRGAGIDLRQLPRACRVTLRHADGQRPAYLGTCLRNAGAVASQPGRGQSRHHR